MYTKFANISETAKLKHQSTSFEYLGIVRTKVFFFCLEVKAILQPYLFCLFYYLTKRMKRNLNFTTLNKQEMTLHQILKQVGLKK